MVRSKVYPLFWRTKSKTIKIFELRNFRPEERLAVRILSVNGLNTNRSAIKVHSFIHSFIFRLLIITMTERIMYTVKDIQNITIKKMNNE